jgi:WXG100 family type VII secretion target
MTTPAPTGQVTFRATPQQIAQVATLASNTSDEVQSQLNMLKGYVEELGTEWLGAASGAFQALMNDFNIFAAMLSQSLSGISEGLHGTWLNYSQQEQDSIQKLQTVNGSLPGAPGATIH